MKKLFLKTTTNNLFRQIKYKFSSKINIENMIETNEEKDIRYEDECYYFEKEWKKLIEEKTRLHQDYYTRDLTEHQMKEVDILVEKVSHFGPLEKQYFYQMIKEYTNKTACVDLHRSNIYYPQKRPVINTDDPNNNPNYRITQNLLESLTPFLASGYFLGGAGAAVEAGQPQEAEAAKEKPKVEEKKEKSNYDIKLMSFDPAKKVLLIKEVRTLVPSLGLKDAKDLVEGAPAIIMKQIMNEDAKKIKQKLEEIGGKIDLV